MSDIADDKARALQAMLDGLGDSSMPAAQPDSEKKALFCRRAMGFVQFAKTHMERGNPGAVDEALEDLSYLVQTYLLDECWVDE